MCKDSRNTGGKSRHETNIVCSVCKVHLCMKASRNCFKKYHTEEKYWS